MTEEHRAEIKMLKDLLNKKCKKDKKSIDILCEYDKFDNIDRKEVSKMKNVEKKVVSLTHSRTAHIVHLPRKWVEEMGVEKDKQIILEYDGKKIVITKL